MARIDRKTLLTIAENGRSLPLTVTNAGQIESQSFRQRRASAIATGKSDESQLRPRHLRADAVFRGVASFYKDQINGEDSGTAIGFPGRQFL